MSERIPGALARAVRDRAGNICEYCHLPQLLEEKRIASRFPSQRERRDCLP